MPLLTFAGSAIQLVPDGTLLLHLAIIVVMVVLLNATLLKPINRILEERESRAKGCVTEARAILAEISLKSLDYECQLRETRAAGYRVMEKERALLSHEREQKIGQVKAEVTRWTNEEKTQLGTDAEGAKASLQMDARATAQAISRQILRREMNG